MFDITKLNSFPTKTGVYLMKDSKDQVLYVGKANNLRARIKQYFLKHDTREQLKFLIPQIEEIEFIIVDTEKEALILENNLIKRYKPKYNILLKDDKTYINLLLTNEKWPMFKLVRKKREKEKYFGPYTNALAAKKTLELLLKLFPLRQCSDNFFKNRKRACILYEIKRCIAPCVGKCSHEEYMQKVHYAELFLKGKNKEILKDLEHKMKEASSNLLFEKADALLKMIKQIEHVQQTQHVENLPYENIDVLNIYRNEKIIIVKLIFRNNRLIGSDHFIFSRSAQEESSLFESFILQHYQTFEIPPLILVPIDLISKQNIIDILFERFEKRVKIIHPLRGEKLSLLNLAKKNADNIFQKEKRDFTEKESLLLNLKQSLKLLRYPHEIQCFDTAHISETNRVSAQITYIDGQRDKKRTKLFKVKTEKMGDLAALEEVLTRHLCKAKEEKNLCDLLIIDGGKAHLNIALKIIKELDIATIDLIAIAKESARHDKGLTKEKIYTTVQDEAILLDPKSPLLFFLQKIRDDAHTVAISFHKKRRSKNISKSLLDQIKGIGPIKKRALLSHFKSVEEIKRATKEDLEKIKGLSQKDIENILSQI